MARKPNENSTRQRAFAMLNDLTDLPRKQAVERLQNEFSIAPSYAKTLYQQHRESLKQAGELTEVFSVRDVRNDQSVTPYIVSAYKTSVEDGDAVDPATAVEHYVETLNTRITQVRAELHRVTSAEKSTSTSMEK